jgi:putative AlgH/UPF0301 family transcriptional regulator
MATATRFLRTFAVIGSMLFSLPALAQLHDDAVILVAHPAFRDMDYRQTVLIAAPVPNGGHVGVILNRPTKRSLGSLFPEHEPSKKVLDPVFYGGPFSRGALVALVKADKAPGQGSVPLMKDLYLAFRANTIDHVIETTPNEARYFVGYVGWRPGRARSIGGYGRCWAPRWTRCSARTPRTSGKSCCSPAGASAPRSARAFA